MTRDELYKKIWNSANSWRGTIDGYDTRVYVLTTLFYRYISEHLTKVINDEALKDGLKDWDYAQLKDEEINDEQAQGIIDDYGFFLKPSQLFENVFKSAEVDEENFNIRINDAIKTLEDSNRSHNDGEDIVGLFEGYDVNSIKLGSTVTERNRTLKKIFNEVASWPLDSFSDNKDDIFGEAYMFLISTYAANAGKSGGEFFTPAEVSTLVAKLGLVNKEKVESVYDPTCGSGSLLLKPIKILGKDNVGELYGQDKNLTTYNLCRMNMWLHGISPEKFHIKHGDTLIDPKFDPEDNNYKFDLIVSNPPYSIKWEGKKNPLLINDSRYSPAGVLAPSSKADWAFVMHSLSHLKNDGTGVFIMFPGALYRSGDEAKIRKYLIDKNFIDAVIQLPENLFFGTSISTCILVLKKNKNTNDFVFIDASKEFIKVTKDNQLSDQNIDNILKMYTDRKNIDHLVTIASLEDLKNKDYNLSVNAYVTKEDTKEKIDIKKLNAELKEIVARQDELRKKIDEIILELEGE
ncbi:type I restriction-modification system subunit M [Mycoplasmopsis gallinarum]